MQTGGFSLRPVPTKVLLNCMERARRTLIGVQVIRIYSVHQKKVIELWSDLAGRTGTGSLQNGIQNISFLVTWIFSQIKGLGCDWLKIKI